MTKELEWGQQCIVTKGVHKGKVVLYDDDDDETGKKAICYPGSILDGYYLIPHKYLRAATPEEVAESVFAGNSLYPDARVRIFKEILAQDYRMTQEDELPEREGSKDDEPDIATDVSRSFRNVLDAIKKDKKTLRGKLLRHAVLVMTWLNLAEEGTSPETLAMQKKARENLGMEEKKNSR